MPWLMTIVTRRLVDAARRRVARSANETTVDVLPEVVCWSSAQSASETSDRQEALRNAISSLPAGQREAIELLKIKGHSLKEASRLTGRSVPALKVNVHRAVQKLKEALGR